MVDTRTMPDSGSKPEPMTLGDGSKVAVIGGGPAGSFFSYFLIDFAERMTMDIGVDICEPKDFSRFGPAGCNHCGGIVSESMVQSLATEGILLPATVVQRGIESYVIHTDVGSARLETPVHEKRIAAVHRGAGPLGTKESDWGSFDGFLQELTTQKGANHIKDRVDRIHYEDGRPVVTTKGGESRTYDLIAGTGGINSRFTDLFSGQAFDYRPPGQTKTYICEYNLGVETVKQYFGDAMHVFLLDIPRLKFGALIPKGAHVTMCILGRDIDKDLIEAFANTPEVKGCFPPDLDLARAPGCNGGCFPPELDLSRSPGCKCFPKINVRGAVEPFGDRLVLIGDCAVTRLYKDGIGGAYYMAKAAASTAVFNGISRESFRKHYWPACRKLERDNAVGKFIFIFTHFIQKNKFMKRGILRVVAREQQRPGPTRILSGVLWDTFTGSSSYGNIFKRTLTPRFLTSLAWETALGLIPFREKGRQESTRGVSW